MRRRSVPLLRNLTTGLAFCGYSAARISWRYVDDWYHGFSRQRVKPFAHSRPDRYLPGNPLLSSQRPAAGNTAWMDRQRPQ